MDESMLSSRLNHRIRLPLLALFLIALMLLLGLRIGGVLLKNTGFALLNQALAAWPERHVEATALATSAEEFLTLAPSETNSVWQGIGDAQLLQGKRESAVATWHSHDVPVTVLLNRGLQAQRLGQTKVALHWFNLAVDSNPESGKAWYLKSTIHFELEQQEQAINALRRAEEEAVEARDSTLLLETGRLRQTVFEPPELEHALRLYDAALSIGGFEDDVDYVRLLYYKGEILFRLQDFEKSIEIYTELIESDTDHYGAHIQLARALWLSGEDDHKLEMSKRYLRRAIVIDPTRKWAYRWLGIIHEEEGDLEAARDAFNRVLEIDPQDSAATAFFRRN